MLSTVLVVRPILLLIGSLPAWPCSAQWAMAAVDAVGAILAIMLALARLGPL